MTMDGDKAITGTFTALPLGLVLTQTVGADPAACAGTSDVTVLTGTTLYYCYAVDNTGVVTLTRHTLENSFQGTVFANLPYSPHPALRPTRWRWA